MTDKEKEIERMANAITAYVDEVGIHHINLLHSRNFSINTVLELHETHNYGLARELINAGYGNVKQAAKKFAEKLKEQINKQSHEYLTESATFWELGVDEDTIDEIVKGICGE